MVHSKEKGAEFERKMCEALSLWVSNGRRDDLYWRAALSGGRATLATRKGRNMRYAQVGDISCIDPLGAPFLKRFVVECKFYKDLKMHIWLYGGDGRLPIIWDKPLQEAELHGKVPFVVAKQNRQAELVLTTEEGFLLLELASHSGLRLRGTIWRNGCFIHVVRWCDMVTSVQYHKLEALLEQRPVRERL